MVASPHVLVVDDHREIREPLARYPERYGLRATVVKAPRRRAGRSRPRQSTPWCSTS